MFGSTSCAFSSHRHVEDLLESFELVVGLEVKGDLPLLLQKGNGGQEIVSCYRVLCLKVISRFPWIYKYSNIISYPEQCSNGDVVQCIGWIGLDHFNGPPTQPYPIQSLLTMTLEIGYVLKHCVLPVSAQPPVSTSTMAFSCASPREQRIKRKPGNQGMRRTKAMLRSSTKKQSRSTLTTSCDSETFLISYSGWMAPPKVLKTF